jgi:hypothetical protein
LPTFADSARAPGAPRTVTCQPGLPGTLIEIGSGEVVTGRITAPEGVAVIDLRA